MAAVNFSGITSGLDTKSIITATLNAQRTPITQLQTKKSTWQTQISNLGKLSSKVNDLIKLATELQDQGKVLATKGVVSDDKVASVTTDGGATAGHYELTVSQLARTEKDRSVGFNSTFSEVKKGTLTIGTPGEDAVDIAIDDGDTLQDVVDKINASDARVDASIVKDGSKSYLQIVASDSGHAVGGTADDAITISESYSGASGGELGLTQTVQAKNAKVNIDGLDIEQRTNTLDDVLPGMKVTLLKDSGTTNIDVAADSAGTKTKLQSFVTLVNDVLGLVKSQTKTADGARQTEPDPAVERLGRDLKALVTDVVEGVSGKYGSLAQVGVKTNAAGTLELDSTAMDKALAADPRSVAKLFTQADTGIGARLAKSLKTWTDPIDGIIGGRQKSLTKRMSDADSQITRMEARLTTLGASMQRQFNRMEQTMAQFQAQSSALSGITSSS